MARFAYGDSYGQVAANELGMDAARDSRYFNSLAANRAAQALALQQQQAEAGNRLSWEQLLAQAAQQAQRRQDIQGQQGFENLFRQREFDRGVTNTATNQSNILADLALRQRGQDLQFGPEQRSDRALARFEKQAPFLADDPSLTKDSINLLDFTPEDKPVAQAIFESNRRKLIADEAERANATAMANKQLSAEEIMEQRKAYADKLLPTFNQGTIPRAASTSWFGDARLADVEPYKAKVLANIMAGEFDEGGFDPIPAQPSDASEIFREVSQNRRMAPSPYNEQAGRFEFTPRFTTPQTSTAAVTVQPRISPVSVPQVNGVYHVSSTEEFAAIPSGSLFLNPNNGQVRRKK